MKPFKFLTAIFTLVVVSLSCQKEFSITGVDPVFPTTAETTPNISATVTGRIVDDAGKPVQGAEVKTELSSVFTDINGEFKMQNAGLYDQAATVQAVKTGFFTGSRTFVARAGQSHFVEIQLIKKTINGSVSSSAGGTVPLPNGTEVTLPSGAAVVKSTGAAYNGNINISAAWIDPTSADLYRQMPGDLRGIDNNNAEVGLESYGMIAVELTGDAGEPLQVAQGKKASLKFPLPASIVGSAPSTIALWSYNEKKGLWIQEGTATKSGNFYLADVTHFSFWNCDAPFPVVDFTATVKDQNGQPLKHVQVRLSFGSKTNTYTNGWTDSSGVVKGKVPSNQALVLEVLNSCGTVAHTQAVGPFTSAANVAVTVTSGGPQSATITGSAVSCTNAAVAKGSAELRVGSRLYRAAINNGSFNFSVELCNSNQSATITVTDSSNSQQGSSSVTLNPGANNTGTLTACGTTTSQFINLTVNGTAYSFVAPTDSLIAFLRQPSTFVSGYRMTSNIEKISFDFNGTSVGTFPLGSLSVTVPGVNGQLGQGTTISTAVTEYGNAGGYIAGSFSGNVLDSSRSVPIQCSFRVKRMQ